MTQTQGQAPECVQLDIRGQICPATLLVALREVNNHKKGLRDNSLRLVILTDNRHSTATIPDAVGNMGYAVSVTRRDGCYCIEVGGEGP